METKLIYTGRGDALYHVPTRDLTDEDFKERAELWKENNITEASLIKSGLYKKPDLPAARSAQVGAETKKDKSAKDGK